MLQRQRHAGCPYPAHADAEQRAEGKQHCVRSGEAAEEREDREPEDREHQRELPTPLVCCGSGNHASDQAHHERHGAERAGEHCVNRERLLDVDEDEGEDGEVEAVEHPSEKRRAEGAPLVAGQLVVPPAFHALLLSLTSGRQPPTAGHLPPTEVEFRVSMQLLTRLQESGFAAWVASSPSLL